jgi:hypothetical protein
VQTSHNVFSRPYSARQENPDLGVGKTLHKNGIEGSTMPSPMQKFSQKIEKTVAVIAFAVCLLWPRRPSNL